MLVVGALIFTLVVVGLVTYRRPRTVREPGPASDWVGAAVPALVLFVGNVLVIAFHGALAALVGLVLMVVGVVLLVRNGRRAAA